MSHLIEVIDNALSPELCQQWLTAFDCSPHQSAGKTGGGVDTQKKRSRDINVTGRPEFRSLLKPVMQATTQGIMHYMRKHPLAMISGLGLKLAHPVTGEIVSVTIDNFAEVAEPQLPLLLQRLFGLGRSTRRSMSNLRAVIRMCTVKSFRRAAKTTLCIVCCCSCSI